MFPLYVSTTRVSASAPYIDINHLLVFMEQGWGLAHLRVDDAHRRFVPHVSLVSLRGRRVEP